LEGKGGSKKAKGKMKKKTTHALVPSPAENVWWLDLDFLSLAPFSSGMWDGQ